MIKVLLIDDDVPFIETLERTLGFEQKYDLKSVGNPRQALAEIAQWRPDIILLDMKMPDCDGKQLIRSLKSDPAATNIPVIFLTGVPSMTDKAVAIGLGAADYITKPFDPADLTLRIEKALVKNPGT